MSQIAANNGGSATWVGSGELSDVLIDFYTNIRNPVLLNPTLTLDQTLGPITEVYPVNIPNLYLGTQMLVCGRYPLGTSSLNFSIEGNALGSITSYIFKSDLSTEAVSENVFLMKIWAKMKIEHLMALYDQMNPNSQEAQNLRQEIIDISVAYGVLCKFTSFSDPGVGIGDDPEIPEPASPALICLKGNYPNPFNPNTTIRFELLQEAKEDVLLKIYNARGQLIKTIVLSAKKPGSYNVPWDGRDEMGNIVPAGLYFYCLSSAEERHSGKMVLLK